jgi:hypothetical protein
MDTDSSPGETQETTEKTTQEIVSEYMESEINVQEMFGLEPGWENEVYFNSIKDAWPGFERLNDDAEEYSSEKNRGIRSFAELIDYCYEDSGKEWNAYICRDDKDGTFVTLESIYPSTGERVIQKIKGIRPIFSTPESPYFEGIHFAWIVDSIILSSEDSQEVALLDKFLKAPNSPAILFKETFGKLKDIGDKKNPLLEESFNLNANSIVLTNPDLNDEELFSLFHELGHAAEATVLNDEILSIKKQALKIYDSKVEDREKNLGDMNLEDAYRVLVKGERTAWAMAYKLLETINNGSKGKRLQFGNYEHRLKLRDIAEESLKTYDAPLKEKDLSVAEKVLGFSQTERAPKRNKAMTEVVTQEKN